MEIKQAPTPSESRVLSAAAKSNLVTAALFGVGATLAIAWSFTPEKSKAAILSVGGIALGGGLTAIRFYNSAIKDGRLDIGDLDPNIASRALFSTAETGRLAMVKDFVEGTVDLPQLGAVKAAIAYQQEAVRPDMHEQVAALQVQHLLRVDSADMDRVNGSKKVVSNPQDAI